MADLIIFSLCSDVTLTAQRVAQELTTNQTMVSQLEELSERLRYRPITKPAVLLVDDFGLEYPAYPQMREVATGRRERPYWVRLCAHAKIGGGLPVVVYMRQSGDAQRVRFLWDTGVIESVALFESEIPDILRCAFARAK